MPEVGITLVYLRTFFLRFFCIFFYTPLIFHSLIEIIVPGASEARDMQMGMVTLPENNRNLHNFNFETITKWEFVLYGNWYIYLQSRFSNYFSI